MSRPSPTSSTPPFGRKCGCSATRSVACSPSRRAGRPSSSRSGSRLARLGRGGERRVGRAGLDRPAGAPGRDAGRGPAGLHHLLPPRRTSPSSTTGCARARCASRWTRRSACSPPQGQADRARRPLRRRAGRAPRPATRAASRRARAGSPGGASGRRSRPRSRPRAGLSRAARDREGHRGCGRQPRPPASRGALAPNDRDRRCRARREAAVRARAVSARVSRRPRLRHGSGGRRRPTRPRPRANSPWVSDKTPMITISRRARTRRRRLGSAATRGDRRRTRCHRRRDHLRLGAPDRSTRPARRW